MSLVGYGKPLILSNHKKILHIWGLGIMWWSTILLYYSIVRMSTIFNTGSTHSSILFNKSLHLNWEVKNASQHIELFRSLSVYLMTNILLWLIILCRISFLKFCYQYVFSAHLPNFTVGHWTVRFKLQPTKLWQKSPINSWMMFESIIIFFHLCDIEL